MELWELVARERIRDTIARYSWSGDSLRLPELLEAFCEDGTLEIRGGEALRGRDAILGYLDGVGAGTPPAVPGMKRIVRHNLANIRIVELTPERAEVSSYFTVLTEIGLDHYGRYRDTFVPVGDQWLIEHRFVSTDWRAEGSTMAPASSVG